MNVFVRRVAARLYPNSLTEFTRLMESEIGPWLRTQEGFLDLITLAASDGTEVAALSFWEHKNNVQIYNSSSYPEVLKTLGNLLDGTPRVKTFEVVGSTPKKLILTRPMEACDLLQETGESEFNSAAGDTRS